MVWAGADLGASSASMANPRMLRCMMRGSSRGSATPAEAGRGRFTGRRRAAGSPADSMRLGRIQSAEVVEHEATLFRREALQLVPRGVAKPRPRSRRSGLERGGDVNAVARRRLAHPLLVLVRLVVRERAAGVEQPVVQALLPLDRALIEAPRLELTGELSRLLCQRARSGAQPLRLHPLELLRQGALPRRQGTQLLQHRLARAHERQQTLRLAVEPLLV